MRCPNCASENREGAKFCDECAAPLPLRCPACWTENRPEAKFCNGCATPLRAGEREKRRKGETEKGVTIGLDSRLQTLDSSRLRTPNPRLWTPSHLAERILAEQAAMEARGLPDGERKTVTALFA